MKTENVIQSTRGGGNAALPVTSLLGGCVVLPGEWEEGGDAFMMKYLDDARTAWVEAALVTGAVRVSAHLGGLSNGVMHAALYIGGQTAPIDDEKAIAAAIAAVDLQLFAAMKEHAGS